MQSQKTNSSESSTIFYSVKENAECMNGSFLSVVPRHPPKVVCVIMYLLVHYGSTQMSL